MKGLFLVFSLLIFGASHAQDIESMYMPIRRKKKEKDHYFTIGPKVQPAVCWISTGLDSLESDGARAGFMYGLDVEFGLTRNIWIGIGLYHDILGGNTRFLSSDTAGNRSVTRHNHNFQYIEMPLCFKFKTNQFGGGKWNVWGKFGVAGAVHLNGQTKVTEELNGEVQSETHVNTDNGFTLFRGAVLVGAGAEYSILGKTRLVGGVVFNNGFTNILKNDLNGKIPSTPGDDVGRLLYIEIVLGAMF